MNASKVLELARRLEAFSKAEDEVSMLDLDVLLEDLRNIYTDLLIFRSRNLSAMDEPPVKPETVDVPAPPLEPKPAVEVATSEPSTEEVSKEETTTAEVVELSIDEEPSLNERFDTTEKDISTRIGEQQNQHGDLNQLIDINKKYIFLSELFQNDVGIYTESMGEFNRCADMADAKELFQQFSARYHWEEESNAPDLLMKLLERKFGRV